MLIVAPVFKLKNPRRLHRRNHWLSVLCLVFALAAACTDTPPSSSQAPETSEWTPDPRFSHIPPVETAGFDWVERYPVIQSRWDVLGIFPPSMIDITEDHIVSTGVGQAVPFALDAANDFLLWSSIRQRKSFQVEIIDTATSTSALSIAVTTAPSLFLEELFTAAAGSGATLNRWWIPGETNPGYLYLEGETAPTGGGASGEVRAYVMEFRRIPGRERGKVDYREIDPVTSITPLRERRFLSEPLVLNTDAIATRLLSAHDTLCDPPPDTATYTYNHAYVVTRDSTSIEGYLNARNGSQAFLLLDEEAQRQCLRQAYLFEIIPGTPPATTAAHRASLPPNMRYEASQYDLAWAEEFNQTSFTDLYDQGYDFSIIESYTGRPQQYVSFAFSKTPETYDDPVKVEDGKLYLGYGVKPKDNSSDCDPESAGTRIFDFEDNCSVGAITRSFFPNFYFKYGYLEIDFARAPFLGHSPFTWLHSHAAPVIINRGTREDNYRDLHNPLSDNLPLREVYNCLRRRKRATICPDRVGLIGEAAQFRWEQQFHGTEVELMEIISSNLYYEYNSLYNANLLSGTYWTVNHYGASYTTPGTSRFYYTITSSIAGTREYSSHAYSFPFGTPYTYGIEWTPEGYIIWTKHGTRGEDGNTGEWHKFSSQGIVRHGRKGSHQCHNAAPQSPLTITDGDRNIQSVIQCGINHVPLRLAMQSIVPYGGDPYSLTNYYEDHAAGETLATSLGLDVDDRFIEIEHIRLYKPRNNYSDITPVYK